MPKILRVTDLTKEQRAHLYRQMLGEWTTTPPTDDGRFWAKWKDGKVDCVELSWSLATNKLEAWVVGREYTYDLSDFSHWLGPLPVPEAPPTESE
jgi:hypothetical protein